MPSGFIKIANQYFMNTMYAQIQAPIQKKDASTATSVLDTSSQSESLQRKADMASNAAQRAEIPRQNNTGMPDNLKAGIESLSRFSMDDVRVHYNSSKPATVQALAYTQGTDIHVAPGQEMHLPHEAWHVAQQMAGRVSPTININGMPVNDNAALEHEADVMGEKAVMLRKENVETKSKNVPRRALQLKPGDDIDMVCAADVWYRDLGGECKHVKGVGYNNLSDKQTVLNTFFDYDLIELGLGRYKKTNEPGKCAEPHAVANALKNIPKCNNSMSLFYGEEIIPDVSEYLDIYVSDSVVRKKGDIKDFPKTDNENVNTFSRCETCAQWIGSDNHVYPYYLEITSTKNNLLEQTRNYSEDKTKTLEKFITYKERMIFEEKTFHNVCFLTQAHTPLPCWLKNDKEIQHIDEQKGLRTIIKKQLLKNRTCEIINQAVNIVNNVTADSDVQECSILSSEYVIKITELKKALSLEHTNEENKKKIKNLSTKKKQIEDEIKNLSMQKIQIIESSKTIRSEIKNKIKEEGKTVYSTIDQIAETEKDLRHAYDFIQQNRKIGTDEFSISENLGFTKKYTEYILGILKKNSLISPQKNRKERDLARKKARDRKYSWD